MSGKPHAASVEGGVGKIWRPPSATSYEEYYCTTAVVVLH